MTAAPIRAILLLALLPVAGVLSPGPAEAGYAPPWCVRAYDGADDCSYLTIRQCRVAVWGTGGNCVVNPHHAGEPPQRPRLRRR